MQIGLNRRKYNALKAMERKPSGEKRLVEPIEGSKKIANQGGGEGNSRAGDTTSGIKLYHVRGKQLRDNTGKAQSLEIWKGEKDMEKKKGLEWGRNEKDLNNKQRGGRLRWDLAKSGSAMIGARKEKKFKGGGSLDERDMKRD